MAGYRITDYAIKKKYKKFVFVTSSDKFMQREVRGAKRLEGFIDRMTKENLKYENFQISDPLDYIRSGEEIFLIIKKINLKLIALLRLMK